MNTISIADLKEKFSTENPARAKDAKKRQDRPILKAVWPEDAKVTDSPDWKTLFNSEDVSWLDALKNDKSRPIKTALLDIVTEFKDGDIVVAHIEEYIDWTKEGMGYERTDARDIDSPVIAQRKDALQIIDQSGYDYCCIGLEEFENLIFKRLGSVENIAAYVIYLNDGDLPTKIELLVEHKTA